MPTRRTTASVTGPIVLVSGLLFVLSTAAAVYFYHQQVVTAEILGENVDSRRVARELETTLDNLLRLLRSGSTDVQALHERIRTLLSQAKRFADKEDETVLVGQLERSFDHYARQWPVPGEPATVPAADQVQAAVRILEAETLPISARLRNFNGDQIEKSEADHRQTIRWMAWGLAGAGSLGSLAGILFGYSVAHGLRRSIHRLSVRVRDAAGHLGQDLPVLTLNEGDNLEQLNDQMHGLVLEIEQVVQRLQQREREVLRAKQLAAVGQLAAGAAHELRNPLTAIKMLIQTNREEAEERGLPVADLLIIDQEIRRMERCLQTFLDFARPPKPERRPLSLTAVVERTVALLEGRFRKQQVALTLTRPAEPVCVQGDADQLQQLLVNLMLNALDAMPGGGTLEIEVHPPAGDHVELRVLDSGQGIPAQLMPQLFEPFVSSKETGLGLGLVVSRRIAEAHGGSLRAVNRPEGGACFILQLPAFSEPIPAGSEETAHHVHVASH